LGSAPARMRICHSRIACGGADHTCDHSLNRDAQYMPLGGYNIGVMSCTVTDQRLWVEYWREGPAPLEANEGVKFVAEVGIALGACAVVVHQQLRHALPTAPRRRQQRPHTLPIHPVHICPFWVPTCVGRSKHSTTWKPRKIGVGGTNWRGGAAGGLRRQREPQGQGPPSCRCGSLRQQEWGCPRPQVRWVSLRLRRGWA
jgi:hypothetical protein